MSTPRFGAFVFACSFAACGDYTSDAGAPVDPSSTDGGDASDGALADGGRADGALSDGALADGPTPEATLPDGASFVPTGPPGSLDTSFAGVGYVTHAKTGGGVHDAAFAVAIDRLGRIVAGGNTQDAATHYRAAAWRLLENGTFDPAFGSAGAWFHPDAVDTLDFAYGVCIDATGLPLLAGKAAVSAPEYMAAWRLTDQGALDSTFGVGGVFTTEGHTAGGGEKGLGVACKKSGGAAVTGTIATTMGVFTLTASGALDTAFSGDGILADNGGGATNDADGDAVALDATGNIVIAGTHDVGTPRGGTVWRVTSTGMLDSTFGGSGHVSVAAADRLVAIAVDSSGRIVVAGPLALGSVVGSVVVRLDATGALDASFGTAGVVSLPPEPMTDFTRANAIAIDSAGRIVVAGWTRNGGAGRAKRAVWRLMPSGAVDTTFGAAGISVQGDTGGASPGGPVCNDFGNAVVVDGFDRPVVAGTTFLSDKATGAMAVWRLNP